MDDVSTTTLNPGLIGRFWDVTLGKKVLMAVSGVVMIGFVTGHMIGNLQLFIGQEQLNRYAIFLQSLGEILWFIRVSLFIWLALHVINGIRLYFENKAARPLAYQYKNRVQTKLSARLTIWTGLGIFAFVVYHLLHFTFIVTNPAYNNLTWNGHRDVYSMVVLGFNNPIIAAVYILAIACLALHLRHSLQSMFQTMGWNSDKVLPKLDAFSLIYAWVMFIGYISMPIAVCLGVIKLPAGVL